MKLKYLFLIFIFALVGFIAYEALTFPNHPVGKESILEVQRGMGVQGVIAELEKNGLTDSPRLLQIYFRYRQVGKGLKAGEYQIQPQSTPESIATQLIRGDRIRRTFTIPEGYNLSEIARLLESKGLGSAAEFLAKCRRADLMVKEKLEGKILEGYLFPDTYEYTRDMSADEIIHLMVKNFKSHFTDSLRSRAQEQGMTPYQILILASLIEKETSKDEERPLVASVFYNRLKQGIPLATDPSVIYGVENFDGNLRRVDLDRDGPYNTYRRAGLPPTPIANPGLKSILAALNPATTDYLYFVSRGNGTHQFSRTYEEHRAAVNQFQLGKTSETQPVM